MKKKSLIVLIMALVALLIIPMTASADTINGWVQNPDGTWSYYYGGNMFTDTLFFYDRDDDGNGDDLYYVDENGIMLTSSWYQEADDDWYYFGADGAAYRDGVFEVDGSYYYFAEAGTIFIDTQRSFNGEYIEEIDDWYVGDVYRAKENGALYRNEWYETEWGAWYYYGADCKAARGIVNVNGTTYLFDDWGRWVEQGTATLVGKNGYQFYVADSAGGIYQVYNNNWIQTADGWYFVQDNEFCNDDIYTINGVEYGFDYDGSMFDNEPFSLYIYNEETDEGKWYEFFAKAGGQIAKNDWVYNDSNWYYYGADGMALTGLQTIGGKTYIFNDWGEAYCNTITQYEDKIYLIDEGCVATEQNGWFEFKNHWFYTQDGEIYVDGVYEIGGKLWAFDGSAALAERNEIFYDEISGNLYLLNNDGSVVTQPGWQKGRAYGTSGVWVYVNDDYTLFVGYLNDGGKTYFMAPEMINSNLVIDGEYLYNIGTDGVAYPVTQDGIYHLTDIVSVYVYNGKLVRNSWAQIGADWYYFDYDGWMIKDGTYATYYGDGKYGNFYFDASGKLWMNGWIRSTYGHWYWADASDEGVLYTGIDSAGYLFDEYGVLLTSFVGECYGEIYATNADGVIIATLEDGWNTVNGRTYYVAGGELAVGQRTIDGKTYRFDYDDYSMKTNYFYNNRYFGADGAAVTGWFWLNGFWYYGDAEDDGWLLSGGAYEIDGKDFLFIDSVLQINTTMSDGYYIYTTNGNGEVISRINANGWTYDGIGTAYYSVNGEPYSGWIGDYYIGWGRLAIDQIVYDNNKQYYVGDNGLCVRNTWVELWGDAWIYAKADGSLCVDEWLNYGGKWYYFDDCYMVNDDIYYVDGDYNKFDENGVWLGVVSKSDCADGWVYLNGEWYYYIAGDAVTYQDIYYAGDWYHVDYDGVMLTNSFNYDGYFDTMHYYGADGKRASYTGWQIIDGQWCYFNADSTVTSGWVYDGYNYYYQEVTYDYATDTRTFGMVTGYYVIIDYSTGAAILYYFNPSGILSHACTQTGWYESNGEWYYVNNGYAVVGEGEYKIGNTYYAFFYDGTMVANDVFDNKYYDSNGALVIAEGWRYIATEFGEGWVYINRNGFIAYYGVYLIDGVEYFFKDGFWVA